MHTLLQGAAGLPRALAALMSNIDKWPVWRVDIVESSSQRRMYLKLKTLSSSTT
jgi:hypothetical protein